MLAGVEWSQGGVGGVGPVVAGRKNTAGFAGRRLC